jgi:hypothetical protein
MPPLKDFVGVVSQWARRKGYALARDMRELKTGLEALRGGKMARSIMARYASTTGKSVELTLGTACFHINSADLNLSLIEMTKYAADSSEHRTYMCRYDFGPKVAGQFYLDDADMVEWRIGALKYVLPYLSENIVADESTFKIASRFAAASNDGLMTTLARAAKLLSDLEAWSKKFPQVLRKSEQASKDLPAGWVWQDEFLSFFSDYDPFVQRFQDLDHSLEGHWLKQTGKLKDLAGRARRLAREPGGKAAVTYPTNNFQFMPHPQKGEHIAYKVNDLKMWDKAFSDWVSDGQAVLKELKRSQGHQ